MKIFSNLKKYVLAHKVISTVVVVVIVFGGYRIEQSATGTTGVKTYIISAVEKGTIVSTVSGTGQVVALDQVDILPKVSGTITSVNAVLGQSVKAGDVIARIDSADALRTLDNANLSVSNAEIAYKKALKASQDQATDSSISDLNKAYQNGYNEISSTFIDLPDIFAAAQQIFYNPSHSSYFSDSSIQATGGDIAIKYKYDAGVTLDKARSDYDATFSLYKNTSINSSPDVIVSLLKKTSVIVNELSAALTGTYNTIDYINGKITGTVPSQINTDKTALNSYISKVNNHVSNTTNYLTAIEDAKDSAVTAELNLKSAELSNGQAQATLKQAQDDLYNHTIVAPFDGVIAKISIKVGDEASANSSLATIVTKQKIADISLNEIDAAKVKVGQKATLTFDAVDGLSITGKVSEVAALGTVSQGVVSYDVKITFDTDDDQIKIGMTTTASIATDIKLDVITVPTSAVKTQSGNHYVEVVDKNTQTTTGNTGVTLSTTPTQEPVETGISDNTNTEIISGLAVGDKIISKTITGTTKTTSSAPSIFGATTGNRSTGATGGILRTVTR